MGPKASSNSLVDSTAEKNLADRKQRIAQVREACDEADSSDELLTRLTATVLGDKLAHASLLKAHRAFDSNTDLAQRTALLASMLDEQVTSQSSVSARKYIIFLPIPLAILLIIVLGGMVARNSIKKQERPKTESAPAHVVEEPSE